VTVHLRLTTIHPYHVRLHATRVSIVLDQGAVVIPSNEARVVVIGLVIVNFIVRKYADKG
jgi:hypothetical protein